MIIKSIDLCLFIILAFGAGANIGADLEISLALMSLQANVCNLFNFSYIYFNWIFWLEYLSLLANLVPSMVVRISFTSLSLNYWHQAESTLNSVLYKVKV